MHQIRFRLGLHPRPRWGSSQCSPDPLAGFKGKEVKREDRVGYGERKEKLDWEEGEGEQERGRQEKGEGGRGTGWEERGGKEREGIKR